MKTGAHIAWSLLAVCAVGVLVEAGRSLTLIHFYPLLGATLVLIASYLSQVEIPRTPVFHAFSTTLYFAIVLIFGVQGILAALLALLTDHLVYRRRLITFLLNGAQVILPLWFSVKTYSWCGGTLAFTHLTLRDALPVSVSFLALTVSHFLLFYAMYCLIKGPAPFAEVFDPRAELQEVLFAPVSIPLVLIYTNFGGFYLLLFLLPVLFGTYSFRATLAAQIENKELSTLYTLTQQISTSLELTRILEQMADQINGVLESQGTCVHLLEGSNMLLTPRITRGEVPASLARELKRGEFPIGSVLETREPLCNPEEALDGFTLLAVPLLADREATGVITAIRGSSQPYMKDHLEFLTIVASQASAYIQNARLFEETTRAHRELKEAQGQLVQSSKMAAVGQLAAGIAHEIKNPLGAIMNSAQLLEFSVSDKDDVEAVKFIQEGVDRCRNIIDNLLRYSRQDFAPGEKLNLSAILADTVRLVEHSFTTDGITIGMEVADLPPVLGNQSEMYQIFTNLLTNARDAVSLKGGPGAVRVKGTLEDNSVLLQFSDDGAGIRPEDIPKVFDPFFTTKDIGKGVGLGLSIVAGIIKRMGGTISVRSAPGEGATFSLRIPVAPN